MIYELFSEMNSTKRRFYPYSKILLINQMEDENLYFNHSILKYITQNAVNVIRMSQKQSNNIKFNRILFNDSVMSNTFSEKFFAGEQLIDTLLNNKMLKIRASFHDCPPYVVYDKSNITSIKFDGVEYRFFSEISKNWIKQITLHVESNANSNPYDKVRTDLISGISDVGLCSLWLTLNNNKNRSLSRYYDSQCLTFLVPKSKLLNHAHNIYLPLSKSAWLITLISLIITTIAIRILAFGFRYVYKTFIIDCRFESVNIIILDILNVSTSHGFTVLPTHLPLKILLFHWLLYNFILGTYYTTRYTSILTKPLYMKNIDSVRDFAESDVIWGNYEYRHPLLEVFKETNLRDYIEIANRYVIEKNVQHRRKLIKTGKYAKLVKVSLLILMFSYDNITVYFKYHIVICIQFSTVIVILLMSFMLVE